MLKESVVLPKTAETGQKPGLAHTLKDDVYGLMLGVMFIAFGLNMLKLSGMVTGGIAGIALLLSYFVPLSIGVLFILANIPFMVFCYFSMGRAFTLKTLIVNIALSAATQAVPYLLSINYIHPLFSALVGGTFLGMGILSLAPGEVLGFAMNAGMFHPDYAPVGLYRSGGVERGKVVTGTIGEMRRRNQLPPGTSMPTRLTNSWNIWMWLHSSVISCSAYRNSGELLGSFMMNAISPRIRMLSNAAPTLTVLSVRQRPISICRSSGWFWYHSVAPSGSMTGESTHRGSCRSIAMSGESHAMSRYGSKRRRTEPSDNTSNRFW